MNENRKPDWRGTWTTNSNNVSVLVFSLAALLCIGVAGSLLFPLNAGEKTAPIRITEVMAQNGSAYPAADGGYYPWVELLNDSADVVELSDWSIGKNYDVRGSCLLPERTLYPGERTVVFFTKNREGLYSVPLEISKNGDDLLIFGSDGKADVYLAVPAMAANSCMAYNEETGEWKNTSMYTPGEENTEAGYARVLESLSAPETVRINEVVPANRTSLILPDGSAPDWVELYNPGPQEADLTGWSITNTLSKRRRWRFPEGMRIAPGEYLVLYAAEGDDKSVYLGFACSADKGGIYLIDPYGRCSSSLNWNDVEHDGSVSRLSGSEVSKDYAASPGYGNATQLFVDTNEIQRAERARITNENDEQIYINEVACSMQDYSDWVEIYNAADRMADIGGWWLSDKKSEPKLWQFPAGTGIAPGGYLLVWLCGDGEPKGDVPAGSLVANISLSVSKTLDDKQNILLSKPDGTIVDRIRMKNQRTNVSYGRADGFDKYRYFTDMTPGRKNSSQSYEDCLAEVRFSVSSGPQKEKKISLELFSTGGGTIYYTLDGSEPDQSSRKYSGPLTLDENTVVSAIAMENGKIPSEVAVHTYIMDHDSTLRTICVTGKRSSLIGSGGVLNTAKRTELPVNVEIYDYDGTLMIDQKCAFKTAGKQSRVIMPQKAFKLKAKKAYGKGKFKAKLFTNRDYDEYDVLLIRASGQDMKASHMKDSIVTSLASATSVAYQETELCRVYINGTYWGMYNMREDMNGSSLAQFEGWNGAKDKLDILTGGDMKRQQGSREYYSKMMSYVKSHSFREDSDVEGLRQYLDIENYLEYVCLCVYADHQDLGNILAYRNGEADGLWRWGFFDQDISYRSNRDTMSMWMSHAGKIGVITTADNTIFYRLMKNAGVRDQFLTRMGELLATEFSSANVQGKIMERYERIKDEMRYSCSKWEISYDTFQKSVGKLYRYAGNRTESVLGHMKKAFDLSDSDMQKYFSVAIEQEKNRTVTADGQYDEDDEEEN